MRHSFRTEQPVPYPRDEVFAFFADPNNLPPLMPGWQRARVERTHYVAPPVPYTGALAGKGSLITISFRPIPFLPLRLEWDAYIAEFQWNDFFCDEQRRGPFQYFHHCHRIRKEDTGSVVCDEVEYELPLGWLGDLADAVVVRRQIQALFIHRQRMLLELLAER
jgi:ligand-binding SRPBCC domain-containing protein